MAADQRTFRLTPRVVVGQVHREPLERLAEVFGGGLRARGDKDGRRTLWVWEAGGANRAGTVLRAVLPLLTVKRSEAEVVLELCDRIREWSTPWQGRKLTIEEIAIRNEIAVRLCDVKVMHRGALPVSA